MKKILALCSLALAACGTQTQQSQSKVESSLVNENGAIQLKVKDMTVTVPSNLGIVDMPSVKVYEYLPMSAHCPPSMRENATNDCYPGVALPFQDKFFSVVSSSTNNGTLYFIAYALPTEWNIQKIHKAYDDAQNAELAYVKNQADFSSDPHGNGVGPVRELDNSKVKLQIFNVATHFPQNITRKGLKADAEVFVVENYRGSTYVFEIHARGKWRDESDFKGKDAFTNLEAAILATAR